MMFIALLAAVQFLTVCPPIVRRPFRPAELGQAVGWFPLVGLALGAILGGLDALLVPLPRQVAAVLVLAAWILLTGALHFDGFLDTCDGLFGGKTAQDRLAIMRDHHVGAFAVAGGGLLLLLKFTLLTSLALPMEGLILAATLGRWSLTLALIVYPYGRDSGLGRDMKDQAGLGQLALATILAALVAWFVGRELGLLTLGVAGLLTLLLARLMLTRVPGLTGDLYGAICELAEAAVLLTLVAALPR